MPRIFEFEGASAELLNLPANKSGILLTQKIKRKKYKGVPKIFFEQLSRDQLKEKPSMSQISFWTVEEGVLSLCGGKVGLKKFALSPKVTFPTFDGELRLRSGDPLEGEVFNLFEFERVLTFWDGKLSITETIDFRDKVPKIRRTIHKDAKRFIPEGHDRFIDAISESENQDQDLLVYSDWLEEIGHERTELIRDAITVNFQTSEKQLSQKQLSHRLSSLEGRCQSEEIRWLRLLGLLPSARMSRWLGYERKWREWHANRLYRSLS